MEDLLRFINVSLMDFFYNHSLLLPDVEYIPGQSIQLKQEKISVLNKIRRIEDMDIVAVHKQASVCDPQREKFLRKDERLKNTLGTNSAISSTRPTHSTTKVGVDTNNLPTSIAHQPVERDMCDNLLESNLTKISWQNSVFPTPPKKITRLNLPTDASIYMRFTNDAINEADVRYDSDLLRTAAVLNQVDRKFIACCHRSKEAYTILLVDQHAADERIQLERLIQEYTNGIDNNDCVHLDQPLQMHLLHQEYEALRNHLDKIEKWHFRLVFEKIRTDIPVSHNTSLWIESVPPIVKDDMSYYPTLPIRIIRGIIGLFMNGDFKKELPEPLLELLKSKACRSKNANFLIHDILLILYIITCMFSGH